jgi:regulator of protease activity HflC (stomatin/prohibitin superfamily)
MAQQFNPNQINPEKFKESVEKLKTPVVFIAALFFLSGPLSAFISIFNFNMEVIILVVAVVVLLASIKQINQYERGVKFTIGKFTGIMNPGWRLVVPVFQSYQKVDMRVRAVDVPDQEAITKDNISVTVNAVIYYRLSEAEKAILEVENVYYAVSQLAQTTMRNVVGEVDLDELLSNRDAIAERIRGIVDQATDVWGVKVSSVELKDVTLPEDMKRVIGKQAEAEREKRSVIIKAEGEVIAAENLAKAARILSSADGALHLRTLNTINDVSSDQSNTIIFATPIEALQALGRIGRRDV